MSWFQSELTTLTFCWRLDRRDGVTVGLTSHDRDLWFRDLRHHAAPGMVPSAIETHRDMIAASVDLEGAVTSALLTEADLAAGLWDAARLTLHAVNWQAPDIAPVFLVRGQLGAVESAGTSFAVELSGVLAALDQPVSEVTTPQCRAALGDARCRVDLRGRRAMARIVAVDGHTVQLDTTFSDGRFALGQLRMLTGPRAGQTLPVLGQDGDCITLADAIADAMVGVRVDLLEGCDRTLTACTARFGNAINFQGEPHLPGNDLLTRYGS